MNVLDLFSGIGGFSLGLERAGFKTIAFCEIDPFCRKVLKKHWPNVPCYEDVRDVTKSRLISDGIGQIDVITGGFPCQDISVAGKQAGINGERSGLWEELARIISDIRPQYAIVENVTALLSGDRGGWFGRVLGDLAEIGYDAEWHCISASAIGAHHHRDRVWIVAYPDGNGHDRTQLHNTNTISKTRETAAEEKRKWNGRRDEVKRNSEVFPNSPASDYYTEKMKTDGKTKKGLSLGEHIHGTFGKLNPPWVEWLMGYPISWTEIIESSRSAIVSSPKSQKSSDEQ